jgi:hypothetical protein
VGLVHGDTAAQARCTAWLAASSCRHRLIITMALLEMKMGMVLSNELFEKYITKSRGENGEDVDELFEHINLVGD